MRPLFSHAKSEQSLGEAYTVRSISLFFCVLALGGSKRLKATTQKDRSHDGVMKVIGSFSGPLQPSFSQAESVADGS